MEVELLCCRLTRLPWRLQAQAVVVASLQAVEVELLCCRWTSLPGRLQAQAVAVASLCCRLTSLPGCLQVAGLAPPLHSGRQLRRVSRPVRP